MANAAARNKLQKSTSPKGKGKVAGTIPVSRDSAPVTSTKPTDETPTAKKERGPSIRSTIIGMIQAGKNNAEITEVLKAQFPTSKAAEKSSVHISFYRSRLKSEAKNAAKE
jgi:hypothetical protein